MRLANVVCLRGDEESATSIELNPAIPEHLPPAAELPAKAQEWAALYGSGPSLAKGQIKLAAVLGAGMPLANAMLFEHEAVGRLFASDDFKEGMKAFSEKRKPEYKGR